MPLSVLLQGSAVATVVDVRGAARPSDTGARLERSEGSERRPATDGRLPLQRSSELVLGPRRPQPVPNISKRTKPKQDPATTTRRADSPPRDLHHYHYHFHYHPRATHCPFGRNMAPSTGSNTRKQLHIPLHSTAFHTLHGEPIGTPQPHENHQRTKQMEEAGHRASPSLLPPQQGKPPVAPPCTARPSPGGAVPTE